MSAANDHSDHFRHSKTTFVLIHVPLSRKGAAIVLAFAQHIFHLQGYPWLLPYISFCRGAISRPFQRIYQGAPRYDSAETSYPLHSQEPPATVMFSSASAPIVLRFGQVGDHAWHEVPFTHKDQPSSLQWYGSTKQGKEMTATAPLRVYSDTLKDSYRSGNYTTWLKEKFEQEKVPMRSVHSTQSIEAYVSASISSDIAHLPADPDLRSADVTQLVSWREDYLTGLSEQYASFVAETLKKPDFEFACNEGRETVSVWLLRALEADHADRTDDAAKNQEQTLLESLLKVTDTLTATTLWTRLVKQELDFYPYHERKHD